MNPSRRRTGAKLFTDGANQLYATAPLHPFFCGDGFTLAAPADGPPLRPHKDGRPKIREWRVEVRYVKAHDVNECLTRMGGEDAQRSASGEFVDAVEGRVRRQE